MQTFQNFKRHLFLEILSERFERSRKPEVEIEKLSTVWTVYIATPGFHSMLEGKCHTDFPMIFESLDLLTMYFFVPIWWKTHKRKWSSAKWRRHVTEKSVNSEKSLSRFPRWLCSVSTPSRWDLHHSLWLCFQSTHRPVKFLQFENLENWVLYSFIDWYSVLVFVWVKEMAAKLLTSPHICTIFGPYLRPFPLWGHFWICWLPSRQHGL